MTVFTGNVWLRSVVGGVQVVQVPHLTAGGANEKTPDDDTVDFHSDDYSNVCGRPAMRR